MPPDPEVKILLVDDQPKNLLAIEAVLAGDRWSLVRADSGEEALRRILDDDFAVILMDVQMPGMDGFETAGLIRQRERSALTPIIFVTAYESSDSQIYRGYALGAVDYLFKPIVPAVLRSKVSVFVDLFLKTEQVRRQAEQLRDQQQREYEQSLAEERGRWEMQRLRDEAAHEKQAAELMARKADELARNVADRIRAEEQLRDRARQLAAVVELGQHALSDLDLTALLDGAVAHAVETLGVEFCRLIESNIEQNDMIMRSGFGWGDDFQGWGPSDPEQESLSTFTRKSAGPVVVEDLRTEIRFAEPVLLERFGILSGVGVLIAGRDYPYGTLEVFTKTRRVFTKDDVHYLQSVANVLAAAIQRRRDETELASVRDQLAIQLADMIRLHALGARLSNNLELQSVLEEVLAAVIGLQGADRGVLMLYDRERDSMFTAASAGFTVGQLASTAEPLADGPPSGSITGIISGGIIIEDMDDDPIFSPHLPAAFRAGARTICSTPLLTRRSELAGTIATYFDQPHSPCDRETRLVELYARQAAEFIENARLYSKIVDADRRKDEFLAMLAHELRNPLAPVLNALHYLRNGDADPEALAQTRDIAERQVLHLARLVDDLLDVSRINSGKVQLRTAPIDIASTLVHAVEAARPVIESRRHEIHVHAPDAPLIVEADAARLEQVLTNLLTNAAKYTEPGGRIDLSAERDGTNALLRVRDNGVGIEPEVLSHVFDLFAQEQRSLDRSQGGLGIGLTLVRRLVEMHGGRVVAESKGPGLGSEFLVRLPLLSFEGPLDVEEPPEPTQDSNQDASPLRVLIVDDNVDGARMLARLVESWGHDVAFAHDGPTALELAFVQPTDVIVLDIGLPDMDGYQVARLVRERDQADPIVLIALTGYGQADDRRRSAEAGIDHHLVKPVDPPMLRKLLERCRPIARQTSESAPLVETGLQ
ncbi:MAG: response regulator [Isosphaeraceae bacterium]